MPEDTPIYLDYNATTPADPRVVEAMLPYFSDVYGNPANGFHKQGRLADRAVLDAREQVASLLGAHPNEIIFTAGATESNNLAIEGIARANTSGTRRRIVTSIVEHKAALLPCEQLRNQGWDVIVLPVDSNGRVDIDLAEEVINQNTLLVSIQAANNEIGTLQPIREIAAIAHENGSLVHTDAAQLVGKLPSSVLTLDVDLLSASAHKLYGPKGIGLLYVRGGPRHIVLEPLMLGGSQESGLSPGTLNVPAIVGFGTACELALYESENESARIMKLRQQLEQHLTESIPGLRINGHPTERLPNTSSLIFPDVDADALLLNLPLVMMGTGSACTSGAIEPSHVLQALDLDREDGFRTVRVSLGRFTTQDELSRAVEAIHNAYLEIRGQS